MFVWFSMQSKSSCTSALALCGNSLSTGREPDLGLRASAAFNLLMASFGTETVNTQNVYSYVAPHTYVSETLFVKRQSLIARTLVTISKMYVYILSSSTSTFFFLPPAPAFAVFAFRLGGIVSVVCNECRVYVG